MRGFAYEWKSLRSCRRGAREQDGLVLAVPFLQHLIHQLVVPKRIVIVHATRIDAVIPPPDVRRRDALTKVRLQRIDANVEQLPQAVGVPIPSGGVRNVHEPHARLPQIPLPNVAVQPLDEVALLDGFLEDRRRLAEVRVDPDAHLLRQAALLDARNLAFWVGEVLRRKDKVAPMERTHPEAVEVEHLDRRLARLHALQEVRHGCFVVVGREGRR